MEARLRASRQILALVLLALTASSGLAASARTQNFIVTAATQELATEVAKAAEAFRRDLAIEWLGKELPPWEQPCPITVKVDPRLGAGGATSFIFGGGRPHSWTMSVQGSRERVLDSVLPHEVTHTIFATHFGRPLPRWADEGACTTVEHDSEKKKQEKLLYQFLTTNRGIPFNRMFAMKEYPQDILPLYSQGYSLARFLIALEGKRKFVDYVGAGMDSNNWTAATKKFYGFHSLSDLQLSWLEWVRKGTPIIESPSDVLYVSTDAARNGRTLAEVIGIDSPSVLLASDRNNGSSQSVTTPLPRSREVVARPEPPRGDTAAAPPAKKNVPPNQLVDAKSPSDGWYARRRDEAAARSEARVASQPRDRDPPEQFSSRARPQPPEGVRQTVVEWSKDGSSLVPSGGAQ